jgi:hypothetical protein
MVEEPIMAVDDFQRVDPWADYDASVATKSQSASSETNPTEGITLIDGVLMLSSGMIGIVLIAIGFGYFVGPGVPPWGWPILGASLLPAALSFFARRAIASDKILSKASVS